MKPLQVKLLAAEKELGSLKEQLSKVQAEVEGLRIRGKKQEEDIKERDARIVELERKVSHLQALLDSRDSSSRDANAGLNVSVLVC